MDIKNRRESNIRSLAVTSRGSITRLAVAIDVGTRKAGWVNRWVWVWGTHHARNILEHSTTDNIAVPASDVEVKVAWFKVVWGEIGGVKRREIGVS